MIYEFCPKPPHSLPYGHVFNVIYPPAPEYAKTPDSWQNYWRLIRFEVARTQDPRTGRTAKAFATPFLRHKDGSVVFRNGRPCTMERLLTEDEVILCEMLYTKGEQLYIAGSIEDYAESNGIGIGVVSRIRKSRRIA